MRSSEFTTAKAEVDHERDSVYAGMQATVHINLKHFSPDFRAATTHVNRLLESYGNVTHADYNAETADINSIVTRLRSDAYGTVVNILGLMPWINKLDQLNTLFNTYVDDTMQETAEKPAVSTCDARRETDDSLQRITQRIEALVTLNGPENFIPFRDEFNALVKVYNTHVHEHYGRLHARTDIAPAIIGSIDAQPYTGRPVTVIPEVALRKTAVDSTQTLVELVFSQDFTVSYRNNIEPGTATLIIEGINHYRGEVITTFSILRE
jgi:hypothetical protein